ncbi:MAG: Holliday junction branch migration protein RuvA, partial [Candidatus Schekmanbacteria bacterium]|nr:Holliday junction branch migration protein RuvA [Candidatus Schekmanbacteria bacterium]
MIGYLSGRLLAADGEELLVAAGGVGYWVTVGAHDARAVMKSAERAVELFVHTQMTVAATTGKATIHLYGFRTPEDLEAFRWVLSVPKLGARIALDLVGTLGA